VKRGRGRPRKYPRPSYEIDAASPSPTGGGVKRGRGRPRKYPRPSYEVDAAKMAHTLAGRLIVWVVVGGGEQMGLRQV
jgi:hypothetical protein